MNTSTKARAGIIAGTAVAALALTGLVGAAAANAADSTPSPKATSSQSATTDTDKAPHRIAEEALTGDAATQVKAAVTAKYPDATIDRMEKDSDGTSVYEAHITKADGTHATVQLDAAYAITGESAGGPGGHAGKGDKAGHAAEEALTGDAATQVTAAVTAKYPDATIDRMEKDSDGTSVYEAHITKADGTHATVQLDAAYAITGESAGGPGGKDGMGGHHGKGRHGGPEGDAAHGNAAHGNAAHGGTTQAAPSSTTAS